MHARMHACIHKHACAAYTSMHVHACAACMCMHVCIHTCIHTYMHIHTCMHIHIYTRTNTRVHMHRPLSRKALCRTRLRGPHGRKLQSHRRVCNNTCVCLGVWVCACLVCVRACEMERGGKKRREGKSTKKGDRVSCVSVSQVWGSRGR